MRKDALHDRWVGAEIDQQPPPNRAFDDRDAHNALSRITLPWSRAEANPPSCVSLIGINTMAAHCAAPVSPERQTGGNHPGWGLIRFFGNESKFPRNSANSLEPKHLPNAGKNSHLHQVSNDHK